MDENEDDLDADTVAPSVGTDIDLDDAGVVEDEAEPEGADTPIPKRNKGGRPKGYPKTGGRKGINAKSSDEIRRDLLHRSQALEVLAQISRGEKFFAGSGNDVGRDSWRRPSVQQRLRAI